ncbi:fimbrial biogenesis chaperone [Pseudomonas sp. TTU2014-080ASC]|uniref:fimbrial biogenesis chaperone n=1 Tax=Pseudomonas sp. TTU2014-080ASC TaxID=1729724 RepID=UPI001F4CC7F9|nr:molecular chaperone [Pseudomonas sp. TTU2014-080ASC]
MFDVWRIHMFCLLNRRLIQRISLAASLCVPLLVQAAVSPDRTRIIYDEAAKSVGVTLNNRSAELPFVVQSWIENESGEKITSPFMVLPPLQRIEANESSLLRIVKLPEAELPKDRESVFYLNVREIPPKSGAVNTIQIALQSKIKLFYRPAAVKRERGGDLAEGLQIKLDSAAKKLTIENPTAFHITVVGLLAGAEKTSMPIETVMIEPFGSAQFPMSQTGFKELFVSNMNDYGGQADTHFSCSALECKAAQP